MANRDVDGWLQSAHFIVGCYNVEDLIQIPGTRWIVGGGLTTGGPGMADQVTTKNYLHVFDVETETVCRVEPEDIAIRAETDTYPGSAAPDWETFGPHGLGIGANDDDVVVLYAVNHGSREAIEVFAVDVSGDRPSFTWVGCIDAPQDGFIDAVAWLPGTDGIVVTALLDPRDPEGSARKQFNGEPVGWVREWHPDTGWKALPGAECVSSPNGVIVSEDGGHVFIAASTGMSIVRIARGGRDPEVVSAEVAGLPDNVRWSADGKSILVGVHTEDPQRFVAKQLIAAKTGGNLDTTFNITRIQADSMKAEIVMPSGLYGAFGGATGAIEVGNRLWVSSCKSDRIAIFDLNR